MTLQKKADELITHVNDNKTVADELYRIHCYAQTLAKLCSTSSHSNPITPEHLQQIFKDIASVTDIASARFYKLSE